MKILLIQTAFLGDVVLATCLIEALHAQNPEAEIDYLVRKGNQGLLENHPLLRSVLVLDKSRKYTSLYALIGLVRKQKYDLVINANRYFSAGLIASLSGSNDIRGYKNAVFSRLFHKTYHHDMYDGRHEIARLHDLIDTPITSKPKLYTEHIPYPDGFSTSENYVTIAPSSVWETKKLPVDKWVELSNKLSATCYVIGGPSDRALAEKICTQSKHPQIINLCGELSLLQSAKLIASAQMNYSNDSAPLHMASATNAPVTAFYLSTASSLGYTPLSNLSEIYERKDLDCRPCGLHGKKSCPKGHFKCANIDIRLVS